MDCLSCGERGAYDRVVVDTVNDTELGPLCPDCEPDRLGAADGDWEAGTCALCSHDGFYALPEWRAYAVDVDGRRIARSYYSLADPCPYLCDEHFTALVDSGSPPNDASTTR